MQVSKLNSYYSNLFNVKQTQTAMKNMQNTNVDRNKQLLEAAIKRADELREAQKNPQHLIDLLV